MTPVPAIYRVVGILTDNWHAANPTGWRLALDAVDARGGRLAEVIRDRYLTLRDEIARHVFDERGETCVIAWERAQAMAAERRNARVDKVDSRYSHVTTNTRCVSLDAVGKLASP